MKAGRGNLRKRPDNGGREQALKQNIIKKGNIWAGNNVNVGVSMRANEDKNNIKTENENTGQKSRGRRKKEQQ